MLVLVSEVILYFNPRSLAGATGGINSLFTFNFNFNPRSLAGATMMKILCCFTIRFQSTLPRGSDAAALLLLFHRAYFNPRSLAGATLAVRTAERAAHISIHAPSRERP